MNKKILHIFFLIFCFAAVAVAQVNLNTPIPTDPNVKIGKLKNGLTYYIRKNEKPAKKVELRLAINAGSILERDDQQGLAHFLEHMAFNGTKNFKKNELVSYLQSIGVSFGADLNAYTSFDETVFILPIPTEKEGNLDKGLLILSDWASEIDLDPTEINKERGVVLEELRLGRGADQRMRDKYFPLLFKDSQYAKRLPIGQKEIISNFDRKAIVDFYEDWYRPDLMAVIAIGDLDIVEMEKKIQETFSVIKAKREIKKRPTFSVPDQKQTLIAVETDKEAAFTSAQVLFKKPKEVAETLTDLRKEMMKSFFNEMLNARLDELRQSPNPPFVFGGAGFSSLIRTKDAYSMFSITDPASIKATLTALLEENKRVREFGFTNSEFIRQKEKYLTNLENSYNERDKTESSNFTDEYIYHFLSGNPIPGVEFRYKFAQEIIPKITLEEVNALAKNTSSEENRVIIVTGAEKEVGVYPTIAEINDLLKKSETAQVKPYAEETSKEPLVGNLPTMAKIKEEKVDKEFGITYWTLSNGAKVALKQTDYQADQILLSSFSAGGTSLVSDDKALSADYVSQVVDEFGLKNLSKVQLEKMLAGKTANVSVNLTNNYEYINGTSTPKDFETLLQLVYLKFTDVNFDKAVFDSFISKQKKFIPNLMANPQFYFDDQVDKIMTQNHPRVFGIPTVEDLDKVDFEQVKAIYKERFNNASDFTFILVGNFEVEKIKPEILKYLGALPSKNETENWKDLGIRPPAGGLKKVIRRGIDERSQVRITFTGLTKFDKQEHRLMSFLGELLTIKLTEVLREEKSGVYDVRASGGIQDIPYERYNFNISFPSGPENVDSLIEAALAEVEKIKNGQVNEKDLDKVKESRIVKLKEDFKRNQYWATEITRSLLRHNKLDSYEEFEARIKAVSKEDIQKVATKYLKKGEHIQIVLLPETKSGK